MKHTIDSISNQKSTDHVAHYSTTTHHSHSHHPHVTTIKPQPQHRSMTQHRRNVPSESSDGSSTTNREIQHLFETHNHHDDDNGGGGGGGFSFDAFGLDSVEMQREVNEAMNDLAGSHPSISQLLQLKSPPPLDDDFQNFGRWEEEDNDDDPPLSTYHSETGTEEEDVPPRTQSGFVDGFRVQKSVPPPPHLPPNHVVRESPTRSERSSLTSESLEQHSQHHSNTTTSSMNMFKQQAGFHTSTNHKPKRVVRPQQVYSSESKSTLRLQPHIQKSQLQSVPKLDAHLAKTSLSPRSSSSHHHMNNNNPHRPTLPQNDHLSPRSIKQQPSVVEFFGEESSTDEEGFHAVVLPKGMLQPQQQHRIRPDDTDAATDSETVEDDTGGDMEVPSDVGVSSETGAAHSVIGHLPFIDIRDKEKKGYLKRTSSPSVRTESTAETTTADEKKDEEFPPPVTSKVGNLRSQWESREQAIQREAHDRRIQRQNVPSTISKDHIERLQNQLGDVILSPELLSSQYFEDPKLARTEDSVQQQRAQECFDQRTSFSSVKERLKSTTTGPAADDAASRRKSKSEGGAAVRHNSVNTILSNLQKKGLVVDSRLESPISDPSQRRPVNTNGVPWSPARNNRASSSIGGNRSETGFESQAMKLLRQQNDNRNSISRRKTPTNGEAPRTTSTYESPSRSTTPRTGNNGGLQNERAEYVYATTDDNRVPTPTRDQPPKQLTYRERRELELQRQNDEEAQRRPKEHEPEKKDVSALIRQRIAANKKNAVVPPSAQTHETISAPLDISTLRTRLRPTPVETASGQPTDTVPRETHRQDERQHHHHQNYPSQQLAYAHDDDDLTEGTDRTTDIDRYNNDYSDDNFIETRRTHSPPPQPTRDQIQRSKDAAIMMDEPEAASLRSPNRSQRTTTPKARDLVIEDDTTTSVESKPGRAAASSAVSHMLMLQQLQQRQPKAPPSIDTTARYTDETETRSSIVSAINTDNEHAPDEQKNKTPKATMMMLNAFLAGREALVVSDRQVIPQIQASRSEDEMSGRPAGGPISPSSNLCALKDDPKYARYFKMLSIGMPMEVVKHAMTRDGLDASVMDNDHNKPVGIPLKDDPAYSKYFRMFKIGLPMEAVKHAMERDGLDSAIMDQDHDLPVASGKQSTIDVPKEQDSHRRARLHWKTLRKVTSNSLWAQIDQDIDLNIEIDEEEFQELFQAEKDEAGVAVTTTTVSQKRGSSVCVIDSKRANNGGIILARLKMSHDDLADAVDRIDEQNLTGEQIENIIEYLPSKDERKALETYMLEGGQDAAEKFDGLCECEKFMVSMMTVKHAKRKVSALLFKLQFESCIQDIQKEACAIEQACEELSSSVRLRQLLGIILTFGNRLNTAGNGKRKAGAFTLDSLLKLNQAKAFDKKTTFLHYIILIVQRNNELLLNFKDDLPTVFASEKIFWDQCVADLEEVENQLENVRKMALYQAHQSQSYRVRRKSKREDPEESLSDADETLTLEEEVEALRSTPIGLFTLRAIKYVSALRDKVESTKIMYARVLEYFGEDEKQLQPHELFSIIVSFSRDFDKAKEQVMANERLKQREERKRQATPGRPITNSPGLSNKKSGTPGTIRLSNMQPNMSAILDELKSNGKRIGDNNTDTASLTPPQIQRSYGNQESYLIQNSTHTMDSHQMQHRRDQVTGHSVQQSTIDRGLDSVPSPTLQPQQRRQYVADPHEHSIPITVDSLQTQKIQSHSISRKSPATGKSKSLHGMESPNSFNSDDVNRNDDNASQVTTETVNSSASTSSIAMRAKARMRRQRSEPRQLPSIPAMSPIGNGTTSSAPSPRTINSDDPERMASPRCLDDTAQPLSPRSNMRVKRRAEYRSKVRRSSSTNTANVQL